MNDIPTVEEIIELKQNEVKIDQFLKFSMNGKTKHFVWVCLANNKISWNYSQKKAFDAAVSENSGTLTKKRMLNLDEIEKINYGDVIFNGERWATLTLQNDKREYCFWKKDAEIVKEWVKEINKQKTDMTI